MITLQHRTRTGKIARLPHRLRDELNRRLDDGEPASTLLPWLNALPEVQAILAAQFDGLPINPTNLTHWRKGGYQDWLIDRNAFDAASRYPEEVRESMEAETPGHPTLVESLAHWVALRYTLATRAIYNHPDEDEQWRLLHQMCQDITKLQTLRTNQQRLTTQQQSRALSVARRLKTLTPHLAAQILHPLQPPKTFEPIVDPELAGQIDPAAFD